MRYLEEGITKKQDNTKINLPGAGVPCHYCHLLSHGANDNDKGRGNKGLIVEVGAELIANNNQVPMGLAIRRSVWIWTTLLGLCYCKDDGSAIIGGLGLAKGDALPMP